MRVVNTYKIPFSSQLTAKILLWAQQFEEVVWLDSNAYQQSHGTYLAILAVDALTAIQTDHFGAFDALNEYQTKTNDWLFGYLTYDLKNSVEQLHSKNHDGLQFPDLYFFQPKKVFLFSENEVELHYLNMVDDELETDWNEILSTQLKNPSEEFNSETPVKIKVRTSKDSYFEKVTTMLQHIERGDIYEANFCQEFYSEATKINPLRVFQHLNSISHPPFAAFLKIKDRYALSASPERYLQRKGDVVISQPIKGTAPRLNDPGEDAAMVQQLISDPKERSENIMITDLVRNDLSRIAKKGSVEVEELCKIYSFEQVHQMISTITCKVDPETSSVSILKNTFPMGSMTGAPKVSAMKIIEELEDAKRGLYSGAVGYFAPNGDFDFNVIIRSILYNADQDYVSYSVGSAITAKSIPENEYEECLLKAKAMREALMHK
ncbi:aminodeoxychorismate synthase component I [Cochleicola gelatinilyticus]|uniref:aminodeoxychorismate synthase n=1 Tax=Cochleicola gelatinilyticus TaxID=1763537 RepID=A0A167HVQ7_9FLAO|nr:aminodeoxychorismate synthase component I [Cochleicola gelatinilyticus]OAB79014.1 aminobenzoate synthetase [Cochleicola gelatinilyticus]